ncbi:YL1 nuclear protein-domain-containing protein [Cyathus striatus]|nr:YL1 nuclear protein-domain-containing protein [Cyathus striatus]
MADEEPVEYLVSRRPRRSTAGNRMAAALAEMALEEGNKDLDDDKEFVVEKFEEDAFESDFESTDEEAASHDVDVGEKEVQEEEKRARKAARSKLEKATAAAHEKHKATFNPLATIAKPKPKPRPEKRRVSLGAVVNAETGEVLAIEDEARAETAQRKRKSKRKHTVLNTSATVTRLKESEEKKASLPKKARPATRSFSQLELIALSLDNEEGNLVEHRDYLKLEEEKRARARVVRKTVDGPLVRWVSRVEDVTEVLQPSLPPPESSTLSTPTFYSSFGTTFRHDSPQISMNKSPGVGPSSLGDKSSVLAVSMPINSIVTPSRTIPDNARTDKPSFHGANVPDPLPTTVANSHVSLSVSATPNPAAPIPPPFQVWPPPQPPNALTLEVHQQSVSQNSPIPVPNIASLTPSPFTTQTASSVVELPKSEPTSQTKSSLSSSIAVDPALETLLQRSMSTELPDPSSFSSHVWTLAPAAKDSYVPSVSTSTTQLPTPQIITYKTTRNYLVHELAQTPSTPKPQWKDTMAALFGDHVKWEDLKVYVGKGRPLSRPVQTCPITGLPAPYMDPRTGTPYANQYAYNMLTRILHHEYAWSPSLGRYTTEIENPTRSSTEEQTHEPRYMEVDG